MRPKEVLSAMVAAVCAGCFLGAWLGSVLAACFFIAAAYFVAQLVDSMISRRR